MTVVREERQQRVKQMLIYKQLASMNKEEDIDDAQANQPVDQSDSEKEGEDDAKFIKYVWNKKTKRLEKRDIRQSNLETIDKYKFERFERVNKKSKVLCQPNENYLNTSIFGDFSPEDAKRELLYGKSSYQQVFENRLSPMSKTTNFRF